MSLEGIPKEFELQQESGIAIEMATHKRFCSRCLLKKVKSELVGGERFVNQHTQKSLQHWRCIAPGCGYDYHAPAESKSK
jgi:hypothetical protein